MIELRHLRTLIALRDAGSLVEAAERVHLTQSALSHQIKDLEERLGTALFVRKTRPVEFTRAGQRLLVLAEQVLPLVRMAERDVARLIGHEPGRLHMAIECHSCFQWLMPTIDRFRDHWPEVEIDIPGGHHFDPLPALAREQLDLVITADPQPLGGVYYEPLFRYEGLLAVARQHRLAERPYVTPADLAEETLITYPVEHARLDVFTQFLDPAGVRPREIRTAELTVMMMQLVASGRGVCALPNWALTEYLERDYVKAVGLGEAGMWSTLYAAIRDESRDQPWMEDFLRTARETSFAVLEGIKPA
ncbi:LysR family transcriptional regulator [Halomonas daqingensis]|uniref:HTH-type transcriptional regulator MetR n=1 Tax=Billgrantia desiderata TaxID=52021 RepID=A0AAW4Z4A6_9GAMM|nr:LysR family transcriptional regulator [Halomonas desiderata]MCE8010106.1 LysR family transcriptional regulator [Halomonas desiderata]MCE8030889.1 LysR family transcriptional regulator [Halomonas desiderata]MCE8053703.1 LysR family transcriptional regulator [Halomonas desiderata]NIC35919.1 LysR family transcriptional regulator [Halomonas desiderata]OUE47232.1 LysR family transcriptional regulator [Halomonas desiderata SP1]